MRKKYYKTIINKTKKEISLLRNSRFWVLKDEIAEVKALFSSKKMSYSKLLFKVLAFSCVAIEDVLGKRLFDVQLMGAIALANGNIVEMKTGEGKTLVAVPAAVFRAIMGESVHIVTVNDYLAEYQSKQLTPVYEKLGLSVGCILEDTPRKERKTAYACDIVYGTNKQFGFDYLRDNMLSLSDLPIQKKHDFVIVDEADSILIDESRTPLIIAKTESVDKQSCLKAAEFVKTLEEASEDGNDSRYDNLKKEMLKKDHAIEGDYLINRAFRTVALTPCGIKKAESFFGVINVSSEDNLVMMGLVQDALYAHAVMTKDKDYVVKNGKVLIVDEFTGRTMPDRRFSNGIHQAIEAKENVTIMAENKICAMITFQNFFKLYDTLSGMTGTASGEAKEFSTVFGTRVVRIPTNLPIVRKDHPDKFFDTDKECLDALLQEVINTHNKKQPVLIGTKTIADSEIIAKLLSRNYIPFNILNAKNNKAEAEIVAQAGRSSTITIATNMAGRGTDILLGGNPEVLALKEAEKQVNPASLFFEEKSLSLSLAFVDKYKTECNEDATVVINNGGLFVIGFGRNSARRIDDQLIGRAGRQGDPGESQFYISFEDELLKKYGLSTPSGKFLFFRNNKKSGKVIKTLQKKVRNISFDARRETFKIDDVNNIHRSYIYQLRADVIVADDIMLYIKKAVTDTVAVLLSRYKSSNRFSENGRENILDFLKTEYLLRDVPFSLLGYEDFVREMRIFLFNNILEKADYLNENFEEFEKERYIKMALISKIDSNWADFLSSMDVLQSSTSLNVFSALTPMQAYKIEASEIYEQMLDNIKLDIVKTLIKLPDTPNRYDYSFVKKIVV